MGFDQPKTIISNGYAGDIAVPMWAGFMKAATRGDKPEWIDRPSSVVGLNVCRISGKLPSGGCDHVEVQNKEGFLETRSMIYTEYFVKGTQPTEECPLHQDRSFIDALAGVFGRETSPPPVPVDATGVPAQGRTSTTGEVAPQAPEAAPPAATAEKPEEPRKRGFWSRLFGRGDDPDQKKKEEEEKKREEERRKSGIR
jgi:penicillin-binding protein 1A